MSSTCKGTSLLSTIEKRILDFLVQRSRNNRHRRAREYFIALPTKITSLPKGACKDTIFQKQEITARYWESQSIPRIISKDLRGITTRLATNPSSARTIGQPGQIE
jgi:hypothetical protein